MNDLGASILPTGSATASGLGWDKLLDPQPRHRARIAATSGFFIRDLGSAQTVECFALISTSLDPTTQLQIRASNTDPTVTSSLLHNSGAFGGGGSGITNATFRGNVVYIISPSVTARYWRCDFLVATNP